MPAGPGKYDDIATEMRLKAQAATVIAIIIEGNKGSGFSVQSDENVVAYLPQMLRSIASEIEQAHHDERKATQVQAEHSDRADAVPDFASSEVQDDPNRQGPVQ